MRLANGLADRGIRPRDKVGVFESNEPRGNRLGSGPPPAPPSAALPDGDRRLDANVTLSPENLASCGRRRHTPLADAGQSYKSGLRMTETVAETDTVWRSPSMYCEGVQSLPPGDAGQRSPRSGRHAGSARVKVAATAALMRWP